MNLQSSYKKKSTAESITEPFTDREGITKVHPVAVKSVTRSLHLIIKQNKADLYMTIFLVGIILFYAIIGSVLAVMLFEK